MKILIEHNQWSHINTENGVKMQIELTPDQVKEIVKEFCSVGTKFCSPEPKPTKRLAPALFVREFIDGKKHYLVSEDLFASAIEAQYSVIGSEKYSFHSWPAPKPDESGFYTVEE